MVVNGYEILKYEPLSARTLAFVHMHVMRGVWSNSRRVPIGSWLSHDLLCLRPMNDNLSVQQQKLETSRQTMGQQEVGADMRDIASSSSWVEIVVECIISCSTATLRALLQIAMIMLHPYFPLQVRRTLLGRLEHI